MTTSNYSLLRNALLAGLLIGGMYAILIGVQVLFAYTTSPNYLLGAALHRLIFDLSDSFLAMFLCIGLGMYHRSRMNYFTARRAYVYGFVALTSGGFFKSVLVYVRQLFTPTTPKSLWESKIDIESQGEGGRLLSSFVAYVVDLYHHTPLVALFFQLIQAFFMAAFLSVIVAATIRHPMAKLRAHEKEEGQGT